MKSKLTMFGVAIADVHRTNDKPICRTEEDFMNTQDLKLEMVARTAKENLVPLFVAGGL